ncbi:glycoside hydrolase family 31 protein [Mangrovivirga cuniculi]|uniref:Glycoside hydrolase family 31 n=1 Tax=Mangrovivirga cuniculi TaxID=2715131 RepID=A0A4D7JVZ1_9BACT|nr:TIM-barrel domain-containing protein [Mangrovivirga cuniculi]QCK14985.1 glycoside hydrolase family 31 [Mangrovivirga cuniculi]
MSLLSESVGSVDKVDFNDSKISLKLSNGSAEISSFDEQIFRVRVMIKDERDFSYAITNPDKINEEVKFDDLDSKIRFSTTKGHLEIYKYQFIVDLLNHSEKSLTKDDSLGTRFIGNELTVYKRLKEDEKFLGLGEKTGPLNKKGRAYVNWNTDQFAYSPDDDPMYCTTPFYLGVHKDGLYGVFLDSTYKSSFNFGASNDRFTSITVENGSLNIYYILGDSLAEITQAYCRLTGTQALPPKWSLGYQQCRYSYYPEHEIRNLARTFRDKKIPADVLYFDIHYMEDYKVFTFHNERFPDPKKLISDLKEDGFRSVVIVDPGIKVEKGYDAYEEGKDKGYFMKYPDGEDFAAQVWPGWSNFPDFTNPEVRDWWKDKIGYYTNLDITGIWNDMNEIASWGQSTPDLIINDYDGDKTSHKKARNVYGMQMARSTAEGIIQNKPNERPFVLTRSAYAGIQRFAAVWTGDNVSSDDHMLLGARMLAGMGLCGMAFAGNDAGGFVGETSGKLFARWIAQSAFTPFFRGHTMVNSTDAEPWSFGEEVEDVSRNFIELRYKLMPYIYSLFWEAHNNGMPIVRTLAYYWSNDSTVYDGAFENQYLFGDSIMVAPMRSDTDFVKIYFPQGVWYDLFTDEKYIGSEVSILEYEIAKYPLFARGGTFFTEQSLVQNTNENHDGVLKIHLYQGSTGSVFNFVHFEDDNISFDYKEDKYYQRTISYDPEKNELVFLSSEGKMESSFNKIQLIFHGFEIDNLSINGSEKSVREIKQYRFIGKISNFDPFYNDDDDGLHADQLPYVEFENEKGEIRVKW